MTLAEQLATLKDARATGEKRVTYNGKTVEFRDVQEINVAIAAIESEIAATSSSAGSTSRSSRAYFSRGLSS